MNHCHPIKKFKDTLNSLNFEINIHPSLINVYICFEELLKGMIYDSNDTTFNIDKIKLYLDDNLPNSNNKNIYICHDLFVIHNALNNNLKFFIEVYQYNKNNELKNLKKCQKEIEYLIRYRKYNYRKINFLRLQYLISKNCFFISKCRNENSILTITHLAEYFGLTRNQINYLIKNYNNDQFDEKSNQFCILFNKEFSKISETEFWS